jgi:hypothetical protein
MWYIFILCVYNTCMVEVTTPRECHKNYTGAHAYMLCTIVEQQVVIIIGSEK